jgi:phosphoheptose isomerase
MKEIHQDRELLTKIQTATFVFICGNGGSAANAEHLSNDLFSKGIKAVCLNSNVSIVTMIGNDFGYEYVYSKQLSVYGNPGDLLITISCSGTSPNVVEAIRVAQEIGMDTYQFEVFGEETDYGVLEDKHLQLIHRIKDLL